jgi:hypothetical protein
MRPNAYNLAADGYSALNALDKNACSEALILIVEEHLPDEVYAQARAAFSEAEPVNLSDVVNAWNRVQIAVGV